jgi:hypothetical protein
LSDSLKNASAQNEDELAWDLYKRAHQKEPAKDQERKNIANDPETQEEM